MVTTMGFLQYYLKSSTKRGWEMSSLLVAIQIRILLRGISSMVTSPLLENNPYLHSDDYRDFLIKIATKLINQ